jgi:hypothetical protein
VREYQETIATTLILAALAIFNVRAPQVSVSGLGWWALGLSLTFLAGGAYLFRNAREESIGFRAWQLGALAPLSTLAIWLAFDLSGRLWGQIGQILLVAVMLVVTTTVTLRMVSGGGRGSFAVSKGAAVAGAVGATVGALFLNFLPQPLLGILFLLDFVLGMLALALVIECLRFLWSRRVERE